MTTVYADVLVLVNLIINYLLLLATAKVCAVSPSRIRLGLAALLGAAYALAVIMPGLGFLSTLPVKLAAAVAMLLVAFGGQRRLLRIAIVFLAVSAAFAGAIFAVTYMNSGSGAFVTVSVPVLVLSFAICYAAVTLVFRRVGQHKGELRQLSVTLGERSLKTRALVDTGNSLTDPITGKPVIVIGAADAAPLFGKAELDAVFELQKSGAATALERLAALGIGSRYRLIPYSAVGVRGGMLLAFRADCVLLDEKEQDAVLIALSPNDVSDNGTYSALVGA